MPPELWLQTGVRKRWFAWACSCALENWKQSGSRLEYLFLRNIGPVPRNTWSYCHIPPAFLTLLLRPQIWGLQPAESAAVLHQEVGRIKCTGEGRC